VICNASCSGWLQIAVDAWWSVRGPSGDAAWTVSASLRGRRFGASTKSRPRRGWVPPTAPNLPRNRPISPQIRALCQTLVASGTCWALLGRFHPQDSAEMVETTGSARPQPARSRVPARCRTGLHGISGRRQSRPDSLTRAALVRQVAGTAGNGADQFGIWQVGSATTARSADRWCAKPLAVPRRRRTTGRGGRRGCA
jgi:hypothetical protein